MEAATTHIRRQLGMIMVEEGFLTAEQLEGAIAEQHRTSKPLGQVLVELGLASAGAVANALAEQHGGLLKTEFGLSAGLHPHAPEPAPAPAPAEPAPEPRSRQPELRVVGDAEIDGERRRLIREIEVLREQCETLSRGVSLLGSELERLQDSV